MAEFKNCILLDTSKEIEYKGENLTWKDWFTPHYKSIVFTFKDTVSKYRIAYTYRIYLDLKDNHIYRILLGGNTVLPSDTTVHSIIDHIENESALLYWLKNGSIGQATLSQGSFDYTGDHIEIRYQPFFGLVSFKIDNPPADWLEIKEYVIFLEKLKEKGYAISDIDSVYFSKFFTWRIRAYVRECNRDFLLIGTGGGSPKLVWISDPDTADSRLYIDRAYAIIATTGLPHDYVKNSFIPVTHRAQRFAEYVKSNGSIREASKIDCIFCMAWKTGSWIDDLHGGLLVNQYFITYADRPILESVRTVIGKRFFARREYSHPTSDFHLHPLNRILPLAELEKRVPELDTNRAECTVQLTGEPVLIMKKDKKIYTINLETGTFETKPDIVEVYY